MALCLDLPMATIVLTSTGVTGETRELCRRVCADASLLTCKVVDGPASLATHRSLPLFAGGAGPAAKEEEGDEEEEEAEDEEEEEP